MIRSLNLPVSEQKTEQPTELCPACQHPSSAHDGIAKRWCAGTQRDAAERQCICSTIGHAYTR